MIPLATFRELFDFNYWARDRQLAVCRTLTQEQFLRPLGSSYSSLRDTLVHLAGGEWVWLEAWLASPGNGEKRTPLGVSPKHELLRKRPQKHRFKLSKRSGGKSKHRLTKRRVRERRRRNCGSRRRRR